MCTGPETMKVTGNEITIGMKIFGRSAGEFLTNCVGAVLAGLNIALSIIDVVKTSDPLQQAMDSMMIVSSGLQLLAIGASWLVSAELVTNVAAVGVLQMVAAVSGPFAIVFAVVGLAIMIAMMSLSHPDDPIQDFIDQHAAPAGLKMQHDTAIDYFNVVPADSSATSLNGISFEASANNLTGFVQLGTEDPDNPDDFSVQNSNAITYLPDTCWSVSTDSTGITTIFTYAFDAQGNQTTLCLAETADGSVKAIPPPPKTFNQPIPLCTPRSWLYNNRHSAVSLRQRSRTGRSAMTLFRT
jgi:hypothetical protein